MTPTTNAGEYLVGAGKLAPPAVVTSVASAGYSLQDWVLIATLIYTVLQTAVLLYKFYHNRKKPDGG